MWSVVASCVTVIMFGTSLAIEPSCPVCSKYEFAIRLLERILSNALALQNTRNKISETHAQVEDSLKAMEMKLNDAMLALEVKKQDLNNNVGGFIDAGIRNLTRNVQEISTIVQSLVAQTTKELDILKANQDVVFKTVLVNEGGTYDYNTGRLTASVAGVYVFTAQYYPSQSKWAILEIVHDGRSLQRSGHYDGSAFVCTSMQAFAQVAMGDKVWVRSTHSTSDIYSQEIIRWSSLAGLLIRI